MSSVFDYQPQRFVHRRPAVTEQARGFCKRTDHVEDRDCLGGLLDRTELTQSSVAQFLKELVFDLASAFVCAEDFCLHFLQLGSDEAFAADGCLLARVVRRHIREVRFCHLDEIAEHGVVTHLERLDSAGRDLALLQLADPIFSFARCLPQRVQIGIKTLAENSALFQRQRRIIDERFCQLFR